MEVLRCGCKIDKGVFIVADDCAYCRECNAVAELHPFGRKRLKDMME